MSGEALGVQTPHWLIGGAIFGLIMGLLIGPALVRLFQRCIGATVNNLHRASLTEVVAGAIGLCVGLLIAILITIPIPRSIPVIGDYIPLLITAFLGYISTIVSVRKKDDLFQLLTGTMQRNAERGQKNEGKPAPVGAKILDTSVIIDGRISDICSTGFIGGTLYVPGFVLEELQHIADSSDVLKRNRGRRGLDILNKMQKERKVNVKVLEWDYDDISEVDTKLVKLAKALNAKVVTNDFNLNKVAELHGVQVLNINELANAVKPIVLPGEEMTVHVIKDGKEQGQGIGYLDDGTMIVVDGGRRYIGETVGVLVTSVLQTAAGRMIFAKPKALERAL
ncbi:MAG: PIN/TRAM domain-containing protein [Firmicutes bacterium]|nr:PIN/TRAM domain-containing protein [Bacillota bacterium]